MATAGPPGGPVGGGARHLDEEEPLVTILPQDVIEKLAELDLELSEGIISCFLKKVQTIYF